MTREKIPPEARPLGELLASYRGSVLNRIILVLLSLFVLLMVAGGTIALFKFGFPGRTTTPAEVADKEAFTNVLKPIMSLLTLAAAGFWGWCIWLAMKYSDTKLLILREGLAFVQGGKVRTCRWNDITKVVYHGPFAGNLVMEGTTHAAYRLKVTEGKDIIVNNTDFRSADVFEFGNLLKSKLEELPRPPAWTKHKK